MNTEYYCVQKKKAHKYAQFLSDQLYYSHRLGHRRVRFLLQLSGLKIRMQRPSALHDTPPAILT